MKAALPWPVTAVILAAVLLLLPAPATAHWCNNIWAAPSRIVVKPEVTTLNVGASGASLRVYVQNNLPYKLFSVQMQGTAAGYTVAVTPPGSVAEEPSHMGRQVEQQPGVDLKHHAGQAPHGQQGPEGVPALEHAEA